jgi:uncharacterized membrane protein
MSDQEKLKPTDLLPPVENQAAEFGNMVEKVAGAFTSLMAENARHMKETAETNKPIFLENNKRHWDYLDKEQGDRRAAGWRNYILAVLIVAFLLGTAGALLYSGDKQNGMAIIGLAIGLVTGFIGGQGWEKLKGQKGTPPAS